MPVAPPKLVPATIHIWCGSFASQALAFAHLMDCGIDDLDRFEVLAAGDARRLNHFGLADVPEVTEGVLILDVGAMGAVAPFQDTQHLTYLGAFKGQRYE